MQDELEDNPEEYHSIAHEYWCDLLYTIEVKENRKRDATQINRLETSTVASNYNSNESVRVLCMNRLRTGVLTNCKRKGGKLPKHHGDQRYCVICKKVETPEINYMSHSSDKCFGKIYYQHSTKEGL